MIRFNYNQHSIIITIFEAESFHITLFQGERFHLLNLNVSQLKCVPLIKSTSNQNILFRLERNIFHWEKGWNESQRQCTKKGINYCTDIYVCDNFVFSFHFFGIWLSVKYKDFFIIKTFFQILHVFFSLYKDKLKMQHKSVTCLLYTSMLHFYVGLFLGRS